MSRLSACVFNRRDFLAALAGIGGSGALKSSIRLQTPLVTAVPTVFFAQPDGRNALVRFIVDGSSAPAGRLRVFDRSRRQLGTAGMIGSSGKLYGELWLPLERETEIVSELEQPQARGVLRTTHTLHPKRRWTVYWMTAEPGPAMPGAGAEFLDTPEFLRLAEGVHPGTMMLDSSGLLDRVATAPLMLAGSGVRWVGLRNASFPLARLQSRDGSSVIALAVAETGTAPLGPAADRSEMARRLERWLDGPGTQLADESHAISLMVATDGGDSVALADRVADWNSRFAYPRIVTDRPDELLGIIEKRAPLVAGGQGGTTGGTGGTPVHDSLARATRVFEPLVARLQAGATDLATLAEQFAFPVPATLVVNATPFTQTGVAVMPDGVERLVSDVPALGYVCEPYASAINPVGRPDAGRWIAIPGSDNDLTLDSRHFQVRIDRETGAIRSLVAQVNGREWVRRGGEINSAPGLRLDTLQKLRNSGIGTRLVATRRSSEGPPVLSSITIYEDLPWLDISNQIATDQSPTIYGFAFALESPTPSWEVPAGVDERTPGVRVERLVHLRWLQLRSGGDTVLFRGLDAPVASIAPDGAIVSQAPARQSRYRLGFASGYSAADDAWRFGWGAEPLVTLPVPGTGNARLASYGSLLLVDQAGASIIDLRRDGTGQDVVLFLQELLGVGRDITLGPGAVRFHGARRIDLLERDLGELPVLSGGGVSVPMRAYGITAIRLTGVELAAP